MTNHSIARERAYLSVVTVTVKSDPDEYCSGCVVVKSKVVQGSEYRTLIITSSEFVEGREDELTVVFWDNRELKATLLAVNNILFACYRVQ